MSITYQPVHYRRSVAIVDNESETSGKFAWAGRVVWVGAVVVVYAAGLWALWSPILGQPITHAIKGYYLGDSSAYMSIARNVQGGHPAYVEPFTETGSSIYPSGYYWLMGLVAKATGTNVLAAWNFLGIATTALLMGTVGAWGRWASRSKWGVLVGPVPLVLCTLQWYSTHWYAKAYPSGSVLWGPLQILFSPSAEGAGLALSGLALLFFVKMLTANSRSLAWAMAGGVMLGLSLQSQTYTALFGIASVLFLLLAFQLTGDFRRSTAAISFGSLAVALIATAALHVTTGLAAFVILGAGVALPIFAIADWRRRIGWQMVIGFLTAALTATPLLVRIAVQVTQKNSFFHLRQQWAMEVPHSLPIGDVLWQTSPVLLCTAFALIFAFRHRADLRDHAWFAALIAVLVTSTLLTFNSAWGMKQEPYRFYPYSVLFLAMTSLPLVFRKPQALIAFVPRIAMVAAIGTTVPTLAFFHSQTQGVLNVTSAEMTDYNNIAADLPTHGIALIDTCIPHLTFKFISGAPTAFYNQGLAIPQRFGAMQTIINDQLNGKLPSSDQLAAADITSFVTMNYCRTASNSELQNRFGAPVATLPMTSPSTCGMPSNAAFEIYNTVDSTPANVLDYSGWNPSNRFTSGPNGEPLPATTTKCSQLF